LSYDVEYLVKCFVVGIGLGAMSLMFDEEDEEGSVSGDIVGRLNGVKECIVQGVCGQQQQDVVTNCLVVGMEQADVDIVRGGNEVACLMFEAGVFGVKLIKVLFSELLNKDPEVQKEGIKIIGKYEDSLYAWYKKDSSPLLFRPSDITGKRVGQAVWRLLALFHPVVQELNNKAFVSMMRLFVELQGPPLKSLPCLLENFFSINSWSPTKKIVLLNNEVFSLISQGILGSRDRFRVWTFVVSLLNEGDTKTQIKCKGGGKTYCWDVIFKPILEHRNCLIEDSIERWLRLFLFGEKVIGRSDGREVYIFGKLEEFIPLELVSVSPGDEFILSNMSGFWECFNQELRHALFNWVVSAERRMDKAIASSFAPTLIRYAVFATRGYTFLKKAARRALLLRSIDVSHVTLQKMQAIFGERRLIKLVVLSVKFDKDKRIVKLLFNEKDMVKMEKWFLEAYYKYLCSRGEFYNTVYHIVEKKLPVVNGGVLYMQVKTKARDYCQNIQDLNPESRLRFVHGVAGICGLAETSRIIFQRRDPDVPRDVWTSLFELSRKSKNPEVRLDLLIVHLKCFSQTTPFAECEDLCSLIEEDMERIPDNEKIAKSLRNILSSNHQGHLGVVRMAGRVFEKNTQLEGIGEMLVEQVKIHKCLELIEMLIRWGKWRVVQTFLQGGNKEITDVVYRTKEWTSCDAVGESEEICQFIENKTRHEGQPQVMQCINKLLTLPREKHVLSALVSIVSSLKKPPAIVLHDIGYFMKDSGCYESLPKLVQLFGGQDKLLEKVPLVELWDELYKLCETPVERIQLLILKLKHFQGGTFCTSLCEDIKHDFCPSSELEGWLKTIVQAANGVEDEGFLRVLLLSIAGRCTNVKSPAFHEALQPLLKRLPNLASCFYPEEKRKHQLTQDKKRKYVSNDAFTEIPKKIKAIPSSSQLTEKQREQFSRPAVDARDGTRIKSTPKFEFYSQPSQNSDLEEITNSKTIDGFTEISRKPKSIPSSSQMTEKQREQLRRPAVDPRDGTRIQEPPKFQVFSQSSQHEHSNLEEVSNKKTMGGFAEIPKKQKLAPSNSQMTEKQREQLRRPAVDPRDGTRINETPRFEYYSEPSQASQTDSSKLKAQVSKTIKQLAEHRRIWHEILGMDTKQTAWEAVLKLESRVDLLSSKYERTRFIAEFISAAQTYWDLVVDREKIGSLVVN